MRVACLIIACVALNALYAQSVTSTTPAANDESVPRNSNLAASFSTSMQAATSSTFVVRGNQRGSRPGTYGGAGTSTLTFNPTVDLAPNEQVFVSLTTGLQTTGSQPLSAPFVYRLRGEAGVGPRDFSALQEDLGVIEIKQVAAGDMNGDGHPDLVIAVNGGTNQIRLNDGFGNFIWTGSLISFGPGNGNTTGIDLGDVDNDGDLDVLASDAMQTRWIYINDGSGSLTGNALPGSASGNTNRVRLADLDGDGDLDAVVAASPAAVGIAVYMNNGSGTFGNPAAFGTRAGTSLDVGDIDGDGDLDIATARDYYINDGAGGFATVVSTGPTNDGAVSRLADIDGDGDLDHVIAGGSGGLSQSWKNNGAGSFTLFQVFGTGGQNDYALDLGDIDGDGDLDMALGTPGGTNNPQILLNNGGGTFSFFANVTGAGTGEPADFTFVDVDRDFDLDLVVARYTTGQHSYVLRNTALDPEVLLQNGPLSEPASIDSIAGAAAFTPVFDFRLVDGGSTAAQSTRLGRVVVHSTGSAEALEHMWRLVPAGFSAIAGTVGGSAGNRTITFDLDINIANGGSLVFTLEVQLGPAPTATLDNETFQLSLATSDIRLLGGSQFQNGQSPLTPAALAYEVVATQLGVLVQPPASVGMGLGFQVSAQFEDASGNRDLDVVGDQLAATRSDAGAVIAGQSAPAVAGVASFSGANLVSLGTPAASGIHLILTDNTGGSVNLGANPRNTTAFNLLDLAVLQSVSPPRNSHTAGTASAVSGTFDRNMAGANPSTLRVQSSARGALAGSVSGAGTSTLTFTPSTALLAGELVDVTFTGGLQSSVGQALGNPGVVRFRTASAASPAQFRRLATGFSSGTTCVLSLLADVDGDGDLDLISSTSAGQLVTHENVGGQLNQTGVAYGGTFAQDSRGVAGDVDLDGDVDIVAMQGTQLRVYTNNGTGTFSAGTPFGTLNPAARLQLCDIDADGDLDVAAGGGTGLAFYLNNGSGSFAAGNSVTGSIISYTIGDVNNDGHLDIIATANGPNTIWFNNGSGSFAATTVWGSSGNTQYVAAGDLDGDGDLDLVSTDFVSQKNVWFNNGQGAFTAGTSFSQAAFAGFRAELADFDGDSDLDLLVLRSGTNNNFLYLNDGTGDFSGSEINIDVMALDTASVAIGDVDGDGDLDIVTANWNDGLQIQYNAETRIDVVETPSSADIDAAANANLEALFSGNASGGSTTTFRVHAGMRGRAAGAVSGNGSATLVFDPTQAFFPGDVVEATLTTGISVGGKALAHPFTWRFRIGAANGPGIFSASSVPATPGGTGNSIATGDMDGDGDIDVLVGGSNNVYVLENDGSNVFSITALAHTGTQSSVVFFDRDNNGDLDIAAANTSSSIRLWTNNSGTFSASVTLTAPRGLQAGDVNGDGWLDLVTGNRVFLNNGSGGFSTGSLYKASGSLAVMALGDVDKDGDLDIAGFEGTNLLIYYNNSDGTFGQMATHGGITSPFWAEFGDMDGNGWDDLVVSSGGGSTASRVYRNFGQALVANDLPSQTSNSRRFTLADVDGDGDLDIAFAVPNGANSLYLNNGSANFTFSSSFGQSSQQGSGMACADFDGDGDLDLVTACTNGAGRIYFNNNPGPAALVSTIPLHETTTASRTAGPVLTFNRDMGTANNSVLPGYSGFRGRLSGNYFTSGPQVSLGQFSYFANEEIFLCVTTGLLDAAGTALTSPYVIHYRTGSYALGNATFATPDNLGGATSATRAIAFGDIDNDGDLDAVLGTYGGPNVIYYNVAGVFTSSLQFGPGNDNTRALALADINRDGRVDIIVGNDGQSVVYLNAASNPFTSTISIGSGGNTAGIAIGDIDGNGSLDIVLADDGGQNRWFPNNFGSLSAPTSFGTGSDPSRAVAVADLDLDGDLDVLVANYGVASHYYLNAGGALGGGTAITTANSLAIACADLNGDRYPDIALGNDGQNQTFLNSSGSFGSGVNFGAGTGVTGAIALGDFDGDGSLDIAEGNDGGQNAVYLNNGGATFGSALPFGSAGPTRALAAVDVNGDAILEIAVGEFQQQGQIFSNDFIPTLDADATVSASSTLTEPSTIDSASGAAGWVDVLDFTIADGGTADGYPTRVSQIVVFKTGSALASWADWRINGPGVTNAVGSAGTNITFGSLNLSVPDGTSATYTVSMRLRTSGAIQDHGVWQFSVDQTSMTSVYPSTTFASATPVTNGSGLTVHVTATELRVTTQPPSQVVAGLPFDAVVRYTDVHGNTDTDANDTLSFVRSDAGTVVSSTSASAAQGVVSFTSGGGNAVILAGSASAIALVFTDGAAGLNLGSELSNTFDLVSPTEWTGATSTDWSTASNWSGNAVPTSADSVLVPSSASNMPVLTANGAGRRLLIQSGATVNLAGFQLSVGLQLIVEGTLVPGTGTLNMLSGATLISGNTVNLRNLNVNTACFLLADINISGNITGSGTVSGQGYWVTFNGTAAQNTNGFTLLHAHVRVSNTSGRVTVNASNVQCSVSRRITIDSGAELELSASTITFTYDTATSTTPLINNGLLRFSGGGFRDVQSANVDLGDVVASTDVNLVLLDGWQSVNTGSLTIEAASASSYGEVYLEGDSDFSSTTLANNGWIVCQAIMTLTPAATNMGNVSVIAGVTVGAPLQAASLATSGGTLGSVTLTGNLTGDAADISSLLMSGTTQLIQGTAAGNRVSQLLVAASATITLQGRLNLLSIQSGANRALTVNGSFELAPGAILELGGTGGIAEVQVNGAWATSHSAFFPPALTRGPAVSQRYCFVFAAGSTTDVDGWRVTELGDAAFSYGLEFQSGATISQLDRLRVEDCEAAAAIARFGAITAPSQMTAVFLAGTSGNNIDASSYTGSVITLVSGLGGGSRFGSAFEVDPGNKLDWVDVPYLTQPVPARNSTTAAATANPGADFAQAMATPGSGQASVYGSHTGRIAGTWTGGGTTSLRLQPSSVLQVGEEVEVRFESTLAATSGPATGIDYVFRFRVQPSGGTGNFTVVQNLSTVPVSNGVVIGDIDRDGDQDVISLADSNLTRVYLNDGYGAFTFLHYVSLGDADNAVLADFNADGWLDIAAISNDRIRVVLNNGSGQLTGAANDYGPTNTTGHFIEAGDLNGDGFIDLVASYTSGAQDQVLLNNGSGAFPSAILLGNATSQRIAIGDVDGDYDLDVMIGERLHRNDGTAAFSSSTWITGSSYFAPTLADFDADGDLDAAVAGGGVAAHRLMLNDGTGSFAAGANFEAAGLAANEALPGDFNGDGLLDVLLWSQSQTVVRVVLNQGGGTFGTPVSFMAIATQREFAVADLDGDGDLDAVHMYTNAIPKLLFNNGLAAQPPQLTSVSPVRLAENVDPNFSPSATFNNPVGTPSGANFRLHGAFTGWRSASVSTPTGASMQVNPSADFRPGEQLLAVVLAGLGPTGTTSARGWQWTFHTQPAVATTIDFSQASVALGAGTEDSRAMALGDFDLDGDMDVAVANSGAQNQIFYNNGSGTFSAATPFGGATDDTRALIAFDIDGDGDLDLVEGNYGQLNRVYTNLGGAFSQTATFGGASDNTTGLAYADFDLDGDMDVAVANFGQQNSIYFNNGSGGFTSQLNLGPANTNTNFVQVGDVDNDYRPDILFGNSGQSSPIYVHDAAGNIVAGHVFSADCIWGLMYDQNGDGHVDIMIARPSTETYYDGNGSGQFNSSSTGTGGVFQGDLNGDGRLDFGRYVNGINSFAPGYNSPSAFNSFTWGPTTNPYNSIFAATADFNGDGRLDIIEITASGEPTTIYFNQLPSAYVQSHAPPNLSLVPANVAPEVRFSHTMNPADSTKWPVYSSLRGKLPGTYGIASNQRDLWFVPTLPLLPGERIEPSITTQMTRIGGTPLQSPSVWTLTARTAPAIPDMAVAVVNVGGASLATRAVAVADFDSDGDVDIALGTSTGTVVFFNDGAGAFSSSLTVSTGLDTRALGSGDMDGDGDMDLVEGNYGQQNYIYLNNGSGSFGSGQAFGTGSDLTAALAIGDLNGDGNLDVFVGNFGQQDLIYNGNGSGGFASTLAVGASTTNTRAAAILTTQNGPEHRAAIFVGDYGGQNILWHPANGGSGYMYARHFGTGTDSTVGLAVADFDSNGGIDVLVINANGEPDTVCLEGFPNYQSPQAINSGADSSAALLADFNGDDRWDVVVARASGAGSQLFDGDGQSGFSLRQTFAGSQNSTALAAADFDGDGDLDLLLGANGQTTARLSGGTAPRLQSIAPLAYDWDAASSAVAQGTFDKAMATPTAGQFELRGSRTGRVAGTISASGNTLTFTPTASLPAGEVFEAVLTASIKDAAGASLGAGYVWRFGIATATSPGLFLGGTSAFGLPIGCTQLSVADLNGDGNLDILARASGGTGQVYLNQGGRVFTTGAAISTPFASGAAGILMADLDGDGDLDLLPAIGGGNQPLLNNGTGSFAPGGSLPAGVAIGVGDLDGDGDADLVWNNLATTPRVEILRNNGAGSFTSLGLLAPPQGVSPSSVYIEDFNLDGRLDLLHAGNLYLNDGGLRFVFNIGIGVGVSVVADLDNDGDIDAVSGNSVFESHNGTLVTFGVTNPFNSGWQFGQAGDIDGDGDLDILFHNGAGDAYQVYRNDGGLTFTLLPAIPHGAGLATPGCLADLDGNGTLDFVGGRFSGGVQVVWQGNAPMVTAVLPANGRLAGTPAATATFDRALNTSTGAMTAHSSLGGRRVGSLSFATGNTQMILTLPGALLPGEIIEVGIPPGVEDTMANGMPGGFAWRFHGATGAASASFPTSTTLGTASARCVTAGDLDGDGDVDLIVASLNGQDLIYLNNGTGIFTTANLGGPTTDSQVVALGDIDGDGDLDAAVGRAGAGELYTNNGSGTFTSAGSLPAGIVKCEFGDLTGDGLPDLATNVGYLVNTGGSFGSVQAWPVGTVTGTLGAVAIGDLNGDGMLDVALGWTGSPMLRLLYNFGGTLVVGQSTTQSADVLDIALANIDADPALEIAVVRAASTVRVYGLGATFTDVGLATDNYTDADFQDADGDGDFDLLLGGAGSRVYLQGAAGSYVPGASMNPPGAVSLCAADFNGDSRIDVAMARNGTASNVLFNGSPSAGPLDSVLSVVGTPLATIDSIAGAAAATPVLTFQIQDQGTLDALSTIIADIAITTAGTANPADHQWYLSGTGLAPIVGTYSPAPTPRLLFGGLNINITSGTTGTYTLSVLLAATPASTPDNSTFVLGLDSADVVFGAGSQFVGSVSNGSLVYQVIATGLRFSTSPGSATSGSAFGVQPVVILGDAAGNIDLNSTGSVNAVATTVAPGPIAPLVGALNRPLVGGVATFSGLQINTQGLQYVMRVQAGPLQADSPAFDVGGSGAAAQPPMFYSLHVNDPDNAYRSGEQVTFTAVLNAPGLFVTADLSVLDSALGAAVSLTDNGNGIYSLTTPTLSSATLIEGVGLAVQVTALSGSLSTTKPLLITVDDTAPNANLSLNRPAGAVPSGVLRINLTGNELLYGAPRISISGITGATLVSDAAMTGTSPSVSWSYDYTLPLGVAGTGTITISQAIDVAGNVAVIGGTQQFTATGVAGGLAADAGTDRTIDLPQRVTLSAAGSQSATGFTWTQVSGPIAVVVQGSITTTPQVDLIKSGTYSFEVAATDGTNTSTDTVNVILLNSAPEVEAGRDHNITETDVVPVGSQFFTALPVEATVFDANGDTLVARWDMLSTPAGGNLRITSPDTSVSTIEALGSTIVAGVYVIGLRVQDPSGLLADSFVGDVVRIVVTSPTVVPPSSHSGFPVVAAVGVACELTGHESADPDAAIPTAPGLSYFWTLERRPPGSGAVLVDATQEKPHITPDVPGIYLVSLVVMDVAGHVSGRDYVRVIANQVTGASANTIPRGVAVSNFTDTDSNGSLNVNEPATLDAGDSVDGESDPISFIWRQIGGPALVFLPDPTAGSHNVQFPAAGVYGFRLEVRDAIDEGIPAELWLRVAAAATVAPVAAGGIDAADDSNSDGYVLMIPGVGVDNNSGNPEVNLNANGSSVDSSLTVEFQWAQTRGPTVALNGANSANASFTPQISRVYEFELTVRDSNGVAAKSRIVVAIDTWHATFNPGGNAVPRVTSAPPQTVTAGAVVTLTGSATDPNGGTLNYIWEQTSGAPVVLDLTAPLMPTFTAPLSGTYEFVLYVDDGFDISPGFVVTVTANPGTGGGDGGEGGSDDGGCAMRPTHSSLNLAALLAISAIGALARRRRIC